MNEKRIVNGSNKKYYHLERKEPRKDCANQVYLHLHYKTQNSRNIEKLSYCKIILSAKTSSLKGAPMR